MLTSYVIIQLSLPEIVFHLQNQQIFVSLHGEALQQPYLKYWCRSAMESMKSHIVMQVHEHLDFLYMK